MTSGPASPSRHASLCHRWKRGRIAYVRAQARLPEFRRPNPFASLPRLFAVCGYAAVSGDLTGLRVLDAYLSAVGIDALGRAHARARIHARRRDADLRNAALLEQAAAGGVLVVES